MPISQADLWARYTAKNPHWLTEGANLTPDGLKKLFDQTYAQGFANGKGVGAAVGAFDDLFSRFRKS